MGSNRVRTLSVFNQPPRPTQRGHPSGVGKMSTGVKPGSFEALSKPSALYGCLYYRAVLRVYVADDADCRLQRLSVIVIKRHYYYYYYYYDYSGRSSRINKDWIKLGLYVMNC